MYSDMLPFLYETNKVGACFRFRSISCREITAGLKRL
jgi:hypothetical protein